jgi:hypothetical protein
MYNCTSDEKKKMYGTLWKVNVCFQLCWPLMNCILPELIYKSNFSDSQVHSF